MKSLAAIFMLIALSAAKKKPYKLNIISLMPTGQNTMATNYPACYASMLTVANIVNARYDILPDYEVIIKPIDEGVLASLAPKSVFQFLDQFDADRKSKRDNRNYLSPIVLGPTVACHTVMMSLKLLGFISFSQLCNGPYIVARKALYNNLYRFVLPGEYNGIAASLFMTQVGNWKQSAILTVSTNPNDVLGAMAIQQQLASAGVDVVYFGLDSGEVSDDTMIQVKSSSARIIAISSLTAPICINFLCRSYEYGMRAPFYLFVLQATCVFSPTSPSLVLPTGCNREILFEQLKITFWFGLYRGTVQNGTMTSLGYDSTHFFDKVDNSMSVKNAPDRELRSICHDVAMSAVIALDGSETILRGNYNASLRDFKLSYRSKISQVVNMSAANLDVVGLRVGKIKYSKNLEIENDLMWIGSLQANGQLRMHYKIERLDQGTSLNLSAYAMKLIEKPTWLTKTGQPPKDLSSVTLSEDTMPIAAVGIVTCISLVITALQSVQARIVFKRKPETAIFSQYIDLHMKGLIFVGCFTLNLASIVLVVGGLYFPVQECFTKFLLTPIGICAIDGAVTSILSVYSHTLFSKIRLPRLRLRTNFWSKAAKIKRLKARRKVEVEPDTATAHRSNSSSPSNKITVSSFGNSVNIKLVIKICSSGIILATLLILGYGPMGFDPVKLESGFSAVRFDENTDSYYQTISNKCVSGDSKEWLLALLVLHGLAIAYSCIAAFQIENFPKPEEMKLECRALKLASVNMAFLFTSFLLIIFIFVSSDHVQWMVNLTLAIGDLLLSVSTSLIVFHEFWKSENKMFIFTCFSVTR